MTTPTDRRAEGEALTQEIERIICKQILPGIGGPWTACESIKEAAKEIAATLSAQLAEAQGKIERLTATNGDLALVMGKQLTALATIAHSEPQNLDAPTLRAVARYALSPRDTKSEHTGD